VAPHGAWVGGGGGVGGASQGGAEALRPGMLQYWTRPFDGTDVPPSRRRPLLAQQPMTQNPLSRALAAGLVSCLAALLTGCSDDSTAEGDLALVGAQLRVALADAGVTVPPAPPIVADELFVLGQALYFDKLLSGNQDIACSTCHLASLATVDGRTLPLGVHGSGVGSARINGDLIPRNAQPVLGAHLLDLLFWDGRVDASVVGGVVTPAGSQLTGVMQLVFEPGLEALAAQAMIHVTSRAEMRGQLGENELADEDDTNFTAIWQRIVDRVVAIPEYVTLLQTAYPGLQVVDVHMGHLGNALAGFEARAFGSSDSPLTRFLGGDDAALTLEQLRGGLHFFGAGRCGACHSGPSLTDQAFHNVGLPQFGPGLGDGLGGDDDFGRMRVTLDPADRYGFRTPSLLNVELTAPYGHVGQFSTLSAMVAHFRDVPSSLGDYDVMDHVTEPGIVGTVVGNEVDVLASLSPLVAAPRSFDINWVTSFLGALTADSARDLTRVIPMTVPSGLTID